MRRNPGEIELLFLHALPLDGTMWEAQRCAFPGRSHAPTLYGLGEGIEAWARAVIAPLLGRRLIVVGCSVGGSLALELAAMAPDKIAALVLVGTKAGRRRDSPVEARVLATLQKEGMEAAWNEFWAPHFSPASDAAVIARAKAIALRQRPEEIARGVSAFHGRPDRGPLLSWLTCPVNIVTGADDVLPGIKKSGEQAQQAPRGVLHVIPECGHYVPLERPRELNGILGEVITAIE